MTSKIKTVAAAFRYLKRNPKFLPGISKLPKKYQRFLIVTYQLVTVIEALNQESNGGKPWEPNWNDSNEYKYYPWFQINASDKNPSGFGFSYTVFGSLERGHGRRFAPLLQIQGARGVCRETIRGFV